MGPRRRSRPGHSLSASLLSYGLFALSEFFSYSNQAPTKTDRSEFNYVLEEAPLSLVSPLAHPPIF